MGKLVPKVKHTARILYLIYLGMTILQVLFLLVGKLPLFDALTTTFGTAGTGGFAIKNDSMMSYTAYQQWVYTIFMALFGVNFNAYYLILFGKFQKGLCHGGSSLVLHYHFLFDRFYLFPDYGQLFHRF